MIKQFFITTLIAATTVTSGVAVAANTNVNTKPLGFYLEGNVGYGKVNQTLDNASKHDNTGFAWNISGGYEFTPHWAADIGYTEYADIDFGNVGSYGHAKSHDPYSVHLAAKGIYPIGNFSLFAKLGLAYVGRYYPKNTVPLPENKGDFAAAGFGTLGIMYNLTNNFYLNLQACGVSNTDQSPSMYSGMLGAGYTFGKLKSSIISKTVKTKTSGFYVDGSTGYGNVYESIKHSSKQDTEGFAWNVNGGYKFNRYFALDLGYANYPNQDFGDVPGYGHTKGSSNYSIHLAAKGILPLTEKFSLFGKFGAARSHHGQSGYKGMQIEHYYAWFDHTPMFASVGASFACTSHVDLILMAEGTASDQDNPAMYSGTFGLGYIF